jgi:hypothetical protein
VKFLNDPIHTIKRILNYNEYKMEELLWTQLKPKLIHIYKTMSQI